MIKLFLWLMWFMLPYVCCFWVAMDYVLESVIEGHPLLLTRTEMLAIAVIALIFSERK